MDWHSLYQRLIFGKRDPQQLAPHEIRQIRNLNTVLVLMLVVGAPFMARAIQWQITTRILGVGTGMVIAVGLLLLNPQRRHLQLYGNLAIVALLCAVIPAILTNGGFDGGAVGWLALLPLLGGFIIGMRGAIFWFLVGLALLVGLYFVDASGFSFVNLTPPRYWGSQRFLQYFGILVAVLFVVFSFLISQIRAEQLSSALIDRLQEEVQQRREAESAARQASEAKTHFLANISHELRTPLNAIIGMTQLGLDQRLEPDRRHELQVIDEASKTLLGLINDVLDFSKIEAERLEPVALPFVFDQMMASIGTMMAFRAAEKGLNFTLDLDPDIPPVLVGDELRLTQVLNNLLSNAIKFTARGSVCLVADRIAQDDETVKLEIRVTDTGIGMSKEYLKSLFTPFSQADASISRSYGGTGLGLAISKRLMALMQGELLVESTPDFGSCFTLRVALTRVPAHSERFAYDERLQSLAERYRNRPTRLLVADPVQQYLIERVLPSLGLVALPKSAEETSQPFLVIADQQHLEKAQQLQATGAADDCLVLAQSYGAVGMPENTTTITQPFCRAHLLMALERLLDLEQICGETSMSSTNARYQPLAPYNVLVVEDNRVNQEVARKILEKLGASVKVANNGLEAVSAVHEQAFDVVLMDVQMPAMDGLQATRCIRKDQRFETLPILAMSAHVSQSSVDACLDAGMWDHIPKPFRKDELLRVLEHWIGPLPAPQSHPDSRE